MRAPESMARKCFPDAQAGNTAQRVRLQQAIAPILPGMPVRVVPDMVGCFPERMFRKKIPTLLTGGNYLTDAHCHLYQLCERSSKPYLLSPLKKLADCQGVQTSGPRAFLGYAVECWLISSKKMVKPFGTMLADHPAVRLTVGVHPATIQQVPTETGRQHILSKTLETLRKEEGVVGAGEVGLDYHHGITNEAKKDQQDFLRRFVTQVLKDGKLKNLPLVLHVRGRDNSDRQASADCIRVLRDAGVDLNHKIYRHCFVGTWQEAVEWLVAFPKTVFGLSPNSCSVYAADTCASVFASLMPNHIVIETDCPKLKLPPGVGGKGPVTPWSTYWLAKWLAALRDQTLSETLEHVCRTMCHLYGLDMPSHNQL